jgi:hypothetical protein
MDSVTTPPPVLLSAADAATYAGVRPATLLRVAPPCSPGGTVRTVMWAVHYLTRDQSWHYAESGGEVAWYDEDQAQQRGRATASLPDVVAVELVAQDRSEVRRL